MMLPRLAPLAAIAFPLFFTPGASRTPAAETDRVYARFEIFGFAGFHVLTNHTTIQEIGDRYAITMDLDTRGLASVFVDLTSHSEVQGELAKGTARPQAYRADVRRNGAERHYAVDYRRDGSVANVATPASSGEPFVIAAEQTRGAVDQLTAYFLIETQLAHGGSCAIVVPVFDGSGFYSLRFSDLRRETLLADGYQKLAGPAQICQVVREDIVVNPDSTEDTYKRGRIWYARVADGRMMPVRMEYDTAFGVVKGYLAEVRGHGATLQLAAD
jgi:hypothetical protein